MADKIDAKLAVGPVSKEVIEAVFQYSHTHAFPIMLIASRNQVGFDRGYVQDWTTKQYSVFCEKQIEKYPNNWVFLCRDHCGIGFKFKEPDTLNEVFKTIVTDLECDFDLIHIDMCNIKGDQILKLKQTKKIMEYAKKRDKSVLFEVGTDTNNGLPIFDDSKMRYELDEICSVAKPEFYVHQTGSLVQELMQTGDFHSVLVGKVKNVLKEYDIKLKEHNADYLNAKEITERKGLVDSINIAPQLATIQTQTVLLEAATYGIFTEDFQDLVYKSKLWKKWMRKNNVPDKFYATIIAGHYHYITSQWRDIMGKLKDCTDIEGIIIENISQVIDHYRKNLCK